MLITDYVKLLVQNRFRIHILKYPMFFLIGGCSIFNSCFALLQRLFWNKKIAETKIEHPPIFIIGHWRSGTTLMHELITLDTSKTYPTNYQAFVPHHFLVTSTVLSPLINLLVPKRRPMDDMALQASAPQEDDFALISLGAPSPYRKIAFSKNRNNDHLQLNLQSADPTVVAKVKSALKYFYRALTLKTGKQLVLKSPPHTGRIKQLAEWFPGAKFIHMSRHPYKMVPSAIRTWKLLEDTQGYQYNREPEHWKEYVFTCKDLMYDAYSAFKSELPPEQLVEVQFEELIKNPKQEITRVYAELGLQGGDALAEKVGDYFQQRKSYKTLRAPLEEELKTEIDRHWESYLKEFGYAD